ncbi:MAG: cob(I)yrinic acid a,c-diamide adenosyltransferase [Tissierellia bacterium]|nr:cob(I)yrinic acid a,c-diamide adenosyltransferase [Tissierellia bacterium]
MSERQAQAIYTKTGDKGQTSLYDGTRVGKDDDRVESYGTVDELGALMGVAINYIEDQDMVEEIRAIQNKLFVVNENLATRDETKIRHHIRERDIEVLEELVDKYMEKAGDFHGFIVNGTSKASALLHYSRTVCRRAERRIVSFGRTEALDPLVLQFVNRLADTLYAFAKACEKEVIDVEWEGDLIVK